MVFKVVKGILFWVILILNIIAVGAMLVCVYSIYLNPSTFPNWSYLGMIAPAFIIASLCFIPVWLIFKWKYSLISIVGVILCWGSIRDYCPINLLQGTPEGKTIKVMSYNVYMFARWTYNDHWDEQTIANYIAKSDADIVCLQESANITTESINEILTAAYPYIRMSQSESPLVLLSRYPILDDEPINLETISSMAHKFNVLIDNDTVTVFNAHLESYKLNVEDRALYQKMMKESLKGEKVDTTTIDYKESFWLLEEKVAAATAIRSRQADKLDEAIRQNPHKHIILCGDLNDSPISYVHHKLTNQLHDAYTEAGNGPGFSYNQSGMYFRLDNILISENFHAFRAKVDKYSKESDHYPIFCTLEMH